MVVSSFFFFFSSRRRHTRCALVTGVQTCALPILFSQLREHAPYGGVVPEIASRAHIEHLDGLIAESLTAAGVTLADLDAIAVTAGPGLIGGVMVGLTTAKALAYATGKPLIAEIGRAHV